MTIQIILFDFIIFSFLIQHVIIMSIHSFLLVFVLSLFLVFVLFLNYYLLYIYIYILCVLCCRRGSMYQGTRTHTHHPSPPLTLAKTPRLRVATRRRWGRFQVLNESLRHPCAMPPLAASMRRLGSRAVSHAEAK